MTRKLLLAAVAVQAAIGLTQHYAVFRELSVFSGGPVPAVRWPPAASVAYLAAVVLLAILWTPRRGPDPFLTWAGRMAGNGLAQIAALGLFHYGLGLVTGRLEHRATLLFLALSGLLGLLARRRFLARRRQSGGSSEDRDAAWSGWDVLSLVFVLTLLVSAAFPYAFEDARVIWGCRAFAFDFTGSLGGVTACSHRNYPPLLSVLLWISVRDPLFGGRLLPWLAFAFFALFLRERLGRVAPRAAGPALLFLVSTVHVWQGAATVYADVPMMVFLSAGTLLSLGLPRARDGEGTSLVAGSLCLSAGVLMRPDGLYYVAVVLAAVFLARLLWAEHLPLAPFALPVLAAVSWYLRPEVLRMGPLLAGTYAGSFLGNATGEWRTVAAAPLAAAAKTLGVFLFSWQGQWLSHKGLGLAIWVLLFVTIAAGKRSFPSGSGNLQAATRFFGLVTFGSLLAVVVCFAAVPFVSDPVGAVQPYPGDYLDCYRNFVRVGLGRMTTHLYPVACLYVVGLLSEMGVA